MANGVRLSIRVVLPLPVAGHIHTRDLRAAGTAGRLTTLNLAAQTDARTTFLVVLCALPNAEAAPPAIDFKDGHLTIAHQGMAWHAAVDEPARSTDPARPLLQLLNP